MDDPNLRLRQSGTLDLEYLKSALGILKVAEIFCLLVAFASLSGLTLNFEDPRYGGRFDFFYFATITTWLLVIVIFVLFLLRLYERVNINWNLVMTIYSPVTAFLLLISSALVLDTAIYYRRHEKKFDGNYARICNVEPCGNVEAAGAFGIISMALFAVDTILYFMKNRNTGSAQPPAGYDGENIDDAPQTEPTGY